MTTVTNNTALGGALQRHADGWRWSDGVPEPRVRDLLLQECAPNFRCATYGSGTVVEIPARWRSARYWPNGRVDPDAVAAIEGLLRECGVRGSIYLEGLDDHRLKGDGWTIDVAQWDAVMIECVGCSWPKSEEDRILARARELGGRQ